MTPGILRGLAVLGLVVLTGARGGADARRLWTPAQLAAIHGDLMLWIPDLPLPPGTAPGALDSSGITARGILGGWVWTLTTPRYGPGQREQVYAAALEAGYTHVAIHVAACRPGPGYHGLWPVSAADCEGHADRLNAVLHELLAHRLIPICAGVSPAAPPAPGLDRSACLVVMDDWDNSAQKDCRIDALAAAFPDARMYVEMPDGAFVPEPDACTPPGLLPAGTGRRWIAAVRQRAPGFAGVFYEANRPNGLERNVAQLTAAHGWWEDAQEVLFESDTYWKFWDDIDADAARRDNDALLARLPWLRGCMSGCSARAS